MYAGTVGSDVEVKAVGAKGTSLATFSLAVNAERENEETLWKNCEAWGKQAEALAKYVSKGQNLYVEGREVCRSWKDDKGKTRKNITVSVVEWKFTGPPKKEKPVASAPTPTPPDDF
jgi:single-strand DNA-binding protein